MKKAFSLVELLVAMIIISLLISAFVPLITKKLKANHITVGSFSSDNETMPKGGYSPMSQKDCDPYNALFIPKEDNDGFNDVCVTKYNVGDNRGPEVAYDVNLTSAGSPCDGGKCCWYGTTADATKCSVGNNADSTYDGCTRTLCTWAASNSSCANWAPKGTIKGSWRLPKKVEMERWAQIINSETQENKKLAKFMGRQGLQITSKWDMAGLDKGECVYFSSISLFVCSYQIWTKDVGSSNGTYIMFQIGNDKMSIGEVPNMKAGSARCVLDTGLTNKPDEKDYKKPPSQADCDPYNALFIPKEDNDGFNDVCVTKYNVGDNRGPEVAYDVNLTSAGSPCDGGKCCWYGTTADATKCSVGNNADSTYDGCTRTLCTWAASNSSCANWAPKGTIKGSWRLPKKVEMERWAQIINSETQENKKLAKFMGRQGLQITSKLSLDGLDMGECSTSLEQNSCSYHIWTKDVATTSGTHIAYVLGISRILEPFGLADINLNSARCVLELDSLAN